MGLVSVFVFVMMKFDTGESGVVTRIFYIANGYSVVGVELSLIKLKGTTFGSISQYI